MVFGKPLRMAISRSGRASPAVRNAERFVSYGLLT